MTISHYLFLAVALLLFLLVVLVWLYIKRDKQKRQEEKEYNPMRTVTLPTFLELQEIIANDTSTAEVLEQAAKDIITYYGTIENFNDYAIVIQHMCQHHKIKAKTIVQFDKALTNKNRSYAQQINRVLQQALHSRK